MREEKRIVRDFYDNYGWRQTREGIYKDTAAWVDLRPVMLTYYRRARRRAKKFLRPQGCYFLDAGSGSLAHPEYAEYSSNYKLHVCVDLSELGLKEARRKLKGRGAYVIADITKLPFREETFDAVVCNHVLYHVPADEQAIAVLEMFRTLKAESSGVIAYTWPRCSFSDLILTNSKRWWGKSLKRLLGPGQPSVQSLGKEVPRLYFHPHNPNWFHRLLAPRGLNYEIRCAQIVDDVMSRSIIRNDLLGIILLKLFSLLEDLFPHYLAEKGRYPFIVIKGGDKEAVNKAITEFRNPFQYLKLTDSKGLQAGPARFPLVTVDPSLEGIVYIDQLLVTSPTWSIEVHEKESLLWLGYGDEQGLQGKILSTDSCSIQMEFQLVPGPARPDSHRTVQLIFTNEQETQQLEQHFDRPTTLTFKTRLQSGPNAFTFRVLDRPTVIVQPNGDTRPLLVLLGHLEIRPEGALPKRKAPDSFL